MLLQSPSSEEKSSDKLKSLRNLFKKSFEFDDVLIDSNFPSGHLQSVSQTSAKEFLVTIEEDPAGSGDTETKNWFYFRVRNKQITKKITVKIENLRRNAAILRHGMYIAFRSNKQTQNQWKMLENELIISLSTESLQLAFEYNLLEGEEARFALSFPYTKQDLDEFIENFMSQLSTVPGLHISRDIVAQTQLGNPIELIRLSAKAEEVVRPFKFGEKGLFDNNNGQQNRSTCSIVLSARVHPAETPSSFMLQGAMEYLLKHHGDPIVAKMLSSCVIYIFPMLNPDGVEIGLTRTDARGVNLNSIYENADEHAPGVLALKQTVLELHMTKSLSFYGDFHSHMTQRGFFLYGRPVQGQQDRSVLLFPSVLKSVERSLRILPKFFSGGGADSTSKQCFSRLTDVPAIYTIETNYWGPFTKNVDALTETTRVVSDFSAFYKKEDFLSFGESFMQALTLVNDLTAESLRMQWLKEVDRQLTKFSF